MDLSQRITVGVIVGVTVIFTIVSLLLGRRKQEETEYTLPSGTPEAPWERGGTDLTAPMTGSDERELEFDVTRSQAEVPGSREVTSRQKETAPVAMPEPIALPAKSRLRPAEAETAEVDTPPALLDEVVKGLEQIPPLP